AHGVARATEVVEATLATAADTNRVFDELGKCSLVPRIDDAVAFARARQVMLLRHEPSGIDVDISLAWLPFELDALAAADERRLAGMDITVARAEDLLIYKAIAWRPPDQEDVERFVTLHGASIDFERVRRVVAEFALVLEKPERLSELEAVIQRALAEPGETRS
ncbi:MAG TPA: hypothetical protein VF103_16765, partial [Polyangiaceae bacterium]